MSRDRCDSAEAHKSRIASEASPQTTHKHPLSFRGEAIGQRPVAENPALRDARFARSSGRGPRAEERTKCASRSTGFASALLRRPGMTTSKLDTFAPIPPTQAKLEEHAARAAGTSNRRH